MVESSANGVPEQAQAAKDEAINQAGDLKDTAVILAAPSIPEAMAEGAAGGFPIGTIITQTLSQELFAGITLG